MSHSVTVTRTTTTTSGSAVFINTGYCKTKSGILKLLEVIIGGIVVGLMSWNYHSYGYIDWKLPFTCIAVTFFIGSLLLFLSCLISLSTGSIISKTSYEFIYHGGAFVLYLIISLLFFYEMHDRSYQYYKSYYTSSILGIVLSILYFFSSYFAYRSYRVL